MVGNCHIDPKYFLDEMSSNECSAVIDSYNQTYKNLWEQTRYIAFINAAVMSNKIKKPTDLLKFEWDIEDIPISKEERIRMEQEMIDMFSNSVKKR